MWKSRKIDLTLEEVAQLLPLVKRTVPYYEKWGTRAVQRRGSLPIITNAPAKGDGGPQIPTELEESLRATLHTILAAHGYGNHRAGWFYDGKAVSVSVSVELPDGHADKEA